MQARSNKKILGWIFALAVLTTSTLAMAHPVVIGNGHHHKQRHYPYTNANRVDNKLEAKFDRNHNGWLGAEERYLMASARVDNRWERHCDHNRNGYIDTTWERYCQ